MDHGPMLYEGKAKQVFAGPDASSVVIAYKDTATAFNGEKKEDIAGKGALNCAITGAVFGYLAEHGVRTHLIRPLDATRLLVTKVEIVPLEVIIRNVAAGSFSKRYGVAEGTPLANVVLEYSYKNDALGDPLINDSQALALGLATEAELADIAASARRVNELLVPFFTKAGLRLVDFKLEYGRGPDGLLLADEISPDTCRFWDAATNEKLDKDRFRRDMGGVIEAYREVLRRVSGGQ